MIGRSYRLITSGSERVKGKGNVGYGGLDMEAAWLNSNLQKSIAFSGQGLMCMDAQRGLTNSKGGVTRATAAINLYLIVTTIL